MKRRGVKVAGVLFVAEGPGRYYSTGRRWGLFHMMPGRIDSQWELYELDADGCTKEMLDYGIRLSDVRFHGQRGDFKLDERAVREGTSEATGERSAGA